MFLLTSRRTTSHLPSLSRAIKPNLSVSHPTHRLPLPYHLNRSVQPNKHFGKMASAATIYDFKPLDSMSPPPPIIGKGQEYPLSNLKDKVILIVNVASKCGFTSQYAGLEELYKNITAKHPDQFVILGFPCNQFGGQEPDTEAEIVAFCERNFGVTFPLMQKIEVNGDNAHPLFEWLKEQKSGLLGLKRIKWNFEKFLIGKDGQVKGRWASVTGPASLEKEILAELEK
ncbi:Putative glutathione peroxidase [Podospora comata]|uniref:Glutathione peroxidase n=1 Tax=Podospora comata TaxID=48703 RepID=A0ABY6S492_PODCO|nr:Putative glutathione peroxidase [Podospora comata]